MFRAKIQLAFGRAGRYTFSMEPWKLALLEKLQAAMYPGVESLTDLQTSNLKEEFDACVLSTELGQPFNMPAPDSAPDSDDEQESDDVTEPGKPRKKSQPGIPTEPAANPTTQALGEFLLD